MAGAAAALSCCGCGVVNCTQARAPPALGRCPRRWDAVTVPGTRGVAIMCWGKAAGESGQAQQVGNHHCLHCYMFHDAWWHNRPAVGRTAHAARAQCKLRHLCHAATSTRSDHPWPLIRMYITTCMVSDIQHVTCCCCRVQAAVGGVMASLIPRARVVPAVRPEDMSQDPRVVQDYVNDPLNLVGNVRAKTGNTLLRAFRSLNKHPERLHVPL